jgi:hypothetical protein
MDDMSIYYNEMTMRIMKKALIGRRKFGMPTSRWTDGVLKNAKILKITYWWLDARNGKA